MPKPIVVSVHGIRTHAPWQKVLGTVLARHDLVHVSYDYRYFNTFRFLWPPARARQVKAFCDYYNDHLRPSPVKKGRSPGPPPSLVAHSFGTYIMGHAMLKHRSIRFDKMIVCGSILPTDFDWATLFQRGQVNEVRHEYGYMDRPVRVAGWVVRGAGASGAKGFDFSAAAFTQVPYAYHAHSDYFAGPHIEAEWMPFLLRKPVELSVVAGRDVNEPEVFERYLDASRGIDLQCYGHLPELEQADVPRGRSREWIGMEPDIYTFLVDARQGVKGYLNAMPLTDEAFEGVRSGRLTDRDILPGHLSPFRTDDSVKLYLMSIAIAPDARRIGEGLHQPAMQQLMFGLTDKLVNYHTSAGIRVEEIVAAGWTPEGQLLARYLGMKEVGKDMLGHPVYSLRLADAAPNRRMFAGLRKLVELYRSAGRA
ncbi:MAG TPA: alpha/beta hydrolase [Longimicrobium sp.]|nr:alpha/beta hydrolase [Longimicrobium sp.]